MQPKGQKEEKLNYRLPVAEPEAEVKVLRK
jgi:hypothetical protein